MSKRKELQTKIDRNEEAIEELEIQIASINNKIESLEELKEELEETIVGHRDNITQLEDQMGC